jgi:PTS system nitrogen regulatory IIA component
MSDVLTLKQLADHLQLSERTIYRLLGRGQLPGFKIGGHWRFRRSVVDYWLDLRLGRMSSAELHEMGQEWRPDSLSLSDALLEENALLHITAGSSRDIIGSFVHGVAFPEPVNADQVLARIWEREQLASTASEGGVAFLHTARWDLRAMHRSDLLAIGRLATPVDFGAIDGGPTDILLLLLARDARQHLILLAKAVQLCRNPGFLDSVRKATTAGAVVTLVRNAERALFAAVLPATSS